MTLDKAIEYCEQMAEEYKKKLNVYENMEDDRSLFKEETECRLHTEKYCQFAKWLKELKELKEQKPCDDEIVICKQAVLKQLKGCLTGGEKEYNYVKLHIDSIPPANTKPKIGHWIDTGSGQECSECGEIQHGYDNFRFYCAKCGSKNVIESEVEE